MNKMNILELTREQAQEMQEALDARLTELEQKIKIANDTIEFFDTCWVKNESYETGEHCDGEIVRWYEDAISSINQRITEHMDEQTAALTEMEEEHEELFEQYKGISGT